jgi:RNA polymerase sigma factor (sigma-70 family)
MQESVERVRDCRSLNVSPGVEHLEQLIQRDGDRWPDLAGQLRSCLDAMTAIDSVSGFERIVNFCLDAGYRGDGLLAFVFLTLNRRFAARISKRLRSSQLGARQSDVEDLVMITMEGVQRLFHRSDRDRHTVTYGLLLAIADHRTIDYLRRKKAELVPCVDSRVDRDLPTFGRDMGPEHPYENKEQERQLRLIRTAVLSSVNALDDDERKALIFVEVEGLGYQDIAEKLAMKATDVGNFIRRARKSRDVNFIAALRAEPRLQGHIGYAQLQADKELRTNLLRWAAEVGDGLCFRCMTAHAHLHTAERECLEVPQVRVDGLAAGLLGQRVQVARL